MKFDFFVNSTAKVIDSIIVELKQSQLFELIHCDRKIDKNCWKVGLNGQMLINAAEVVFGYRNPYIFANAKFCSIEIISRLIQTQYYHRWSNEQHIVV